MTIPNRQSVDAPLDWQALEEITDGDHALEARLLALFFQTTDHCLDSLQRACDEGDDPRWKAQSHALKGAGLNIGAQRLAELAAQCQCAYGASPAEKRGFIARLQSEVEYLHAALEERGSGEK